MRKAVVASLPPQSVFQEQAGASAELHGQLRHSASVASDGPWSEERACSSLAVQVAEFF